MVTVKYTLHGNARARRVLRAAQAAGTVGAFNFYSAEARRAIQDQMQLQIEDEGRFSGGWAQLTDKYAKWKAKKYPGKGIGQASGRMLQVLTNFGGGRSFKDFQGIGTGSVTGLFRSLGGLSDSDVASDIRITFNKRGSFKVSLRVPLKYVKYFHKLRPILFITPGTKAYLDEELEKWADRFSRFKTVQAKLPNGGN